MKNKKLQNNYILTGADGGTLYSVVIALPLIISLIFSIILIATGLYNDGEFIKSSLFTYISYSLSALSLLAVILFAKVKNNLDLKASISLNSCHPKYYLIALLLLFGALFGLGWVNDKFIEFLQRFGHEVTSPEIPKNGIGDYILCFIVVCVCPAIFEECIFRGLLLNGARRAGDLFAVLVCGLLFSLFHKNPAQTVYQFIVGAVLTLLALKSGSILPSILFHFVNNLYVITFYFLAPANFAFDKWVQIVLAILGVIAFALAFIYLLLKCEKPLQDKELDADFEEIMPKKQNGKMFLIFALPGIVAALLMWITNLG